jgi:hypothetical protein
VSCGEQLHIKAFYLTFTGVKWPERETDRFPSSTNEVKNARNVTSISTLRLPGVVVEEITDTVKRMRLIWHRLDYVATS